MKRLNTRPDWGSDNFNDTAGPLEVYGTNKRKRDRKPKKKVQRKKIRRMSHWKKNEKKGVYVKNKVLEKSKNKDESSIGAVNKIK